MAADAFDRLMRTLDAPMAVVTVAVDGERSGCLIGFHSQSSIQPRRHCVWLSKANHTYGVAVRAQHVAVHLLTRSDRGIAELFGTLTGDDVDKFEQCEWIESTQGPPLLVDCPNRFLLRRTALLDEGGDHVGFVGEPLRAETAGDGRFEPMRLADVDDLDAGHPTGQ
jgi:flavin reductase (DIM6/NTAB) family NADH-FMN oxidoreductase RutF